MSLLEDFKPFNFSEGVPYVSVTINGVSFNKSVVLKLNYHEYVVLLINEESKQIAIQVCDRDTPNAVQFYKVKKNPNLISVRWNGRDLINTLQTMMGWSLKNNGYRVDGVLLKEERAMLFDLNKAEELK